MFMWTPSTTGVIEISNFYLCDYCKHYDGQSVVAGGYGYCDVGCNGRGSNLKRKKVMYDYHGKDGKRYDEPTDVCEHYESRGSK